MSRRIGGRPSIAASRSAESTPTETLRVRPMPLPKMSRTLLHVDLLELEIGFRLIGLADPTRGGNLLERLRTVRQHVARELGLIVPQVRIHDEIGLAPQRLSGQDSRDGRGRGWSTPVGCWRSRRRGWPTLPRAVRPSTRRPARRRSGFTPRARGRRAGGLRILDAAAVVAAHFGEIVRDHADELLTRDQIERLLDRVRTSAPTLAGEVVPGLLRPGELQRLLQNLLRERVSIRRPGDDPRNPGRPRRQDQGRRRADRAGPAEPGEADQ